MKKVHQILLTYLLASILCGLLYISCNSQNILYVPGVYQTIQEAMNHAESIDTIEIDAGIYPESLLITKHTFLKGNGVTLSGDSVIISSGKNLFFKGSFVVDAQINLQTGDYGAATFFKQGNLVLNNPVTINKKLTYDLPNFFSCPIQNATAEILMGYYLLYFDEDLFQYTPINDPATPLLPASGYKVFTDNFNDTSLVLIGEPLFEEVQKPLHCSGLVSDGYGFNLIGNPYVSYVNWDLFEKPDGMGHAIYYYDPEKRKYRFYVNGIGNTNPFIPPMQGFFVVYTDSIQASEITFSQDFCLITDYEHYFPINKDNVLGLSVQGNGLSDDAYIHFDDNATYDYDLTKDAIKINPEPSGTIVLYTKNLSSYSFAINSMPATDQVRLFFSADLPGNYTIQVNEISDFAGVWLEDLVTGNIIDLVTNSYTFEFKNYDEPGRFYIHFTPVGNNDPSWVLKVYAYGDKIYINTPDDNNNYFASGRDVFGKGIFAQMELTPGLTAIKAEPDKCYFVKILINNDEEQTYTVYTYNYYPEKNDNIFLLYPNPFLDKLNILQTWSRKNNFIVTILDNLGHEIMRIPSDKYDNQIELGFLKPGIYYFIIEEDNTTNIEIKKMVKQ